jgi:DNA-binding CsgD family transcriptional regulator
MTGELLERGRVLAAVVGCLEDACAGGGRALFVVGEAGLGKTSVLDFARRSVPVGMEVAFGRGEPMEESLAFGLAAQAFEAPGGDWLELQRSAVEPSVPYYRVLRGLQGRGGRPLLLALDDLHWSDPDSLSLFAFLARRVSTLGVALIGSLRPWPPRALAVCEALAHQHGAALEQLEPLGRASVGALLAAGSGGPVADATVERAFKLTGGNPLLAEQLAMAVARGDRVPAGGAGMRGGLLLARFAGLDAAGLEVARAASVFGSSFRPQLVVRAAGLDRGAGERGLDALCRGGLVLEERNGVLRFVHPLFAQALYEDMPASARLRLHARAFELLASVGLEAQAAEHAGPGDLIGDASAIGLLVRVGLAALATGAVESATRSLEAAVALSGDRVESGVLLAFARALSSSGRMVELVAACQRLLSDDVLAWRERIEVLRMLGRALYLTGAPDHGAGALEQAVSIALEHEPEAAVEPLLDRSLSAWLEAGPAAALPLTMRARELAAGAGDELRERAEATWGHMALEAGDSAGLEATEPLSRYLDQGGARELPPVRELIWPWASIYQFAMNANYVERYADAERAFKLARGVMEEAGAANALATLAIYIANAVIRLGRLDDALAEAARAEEFAELTPGVLAYAQLVRAEALVWLGRMEESERYCALAEEQAPGQWFVTLWLAHVRGLRLLWQGDAGASDQLLVAERVTCAVGVGEPCHVLWAGHAVTAHLAVGRESDARRVVEWLEETAARLTCRWPRIALATGRAQLAERHGDDPEAERQYELALGLHEQVRMPLQRIEALLAFGGYLRRRGRPSDARPALARAVALAERTGAAWLAATARDELALAGGRRRRSPTQRDQLTDAEARVAELAAEGLSNAEIARRLYLSINTVQTHLKRVYAKLGITSRHQLRRPD